MIKKKYHLAFSQWLLGIPKDRATRPTFKKKDNSDRPSSDSDTGFSCQEL